MEARGPIDPVNCMFVGGDWLLLVRPADCSQRETAVIQAPVPRMALHRFSFAVAHDKQKTSKFALLH